MAESDGVRKASSVKERMAAYQAGRLTSSSPTLNRNNNPVLTESPRQAIFQKWKASTEAVPVDPREAVTSTPPPKRAEQFTPGTVIVTNDSSYKIELTFTSGSGCYFARLSTSDGQKKQFNILTTMFPTFTIKMLKSKVANPSLVLLDGIYQPPIGLQKVFTENSKLKDLGCAPTQAGVHSFTFELKQDEKKGDAVIVNKIENAEAVSDRRNLWANIEKKGREEFFGIKSDDQPSKSDSNKDLSSLMTRSAESEKKREERIEYDAESAEKRAMAEWEKAQRERQEYLERQKKKEEEDALERFIAAEAERQFKEEIGELPKSESDSSQRIQEFLTSPRGERKSLADTEREKRERLKKEQESVPGAQKLLEEEKQRADARATETRKDIERRKAEREEEAKRIKEEQEKIVSVFKGSGRHVGVEIWRIENFEAVKWPKTDYGKFCTGDSYVILQTVRIGGPWKIFFWLGSESSKDETGTAALKAVELDEVMGGSCPHHREVQGHESDTFHDLFNDLGGVQYLDGGVDSAFTKVERDVYPTRLLHCKGKKNVRVTPVPLSHTSLNSGDVFVLDAGLQLYQWCGAGSSRLERVKATQVIIRLRDSRGARAKYDNFVEGEEPEHFWELIGGKGPIAAGDDEDDDAYEARMKELIKLYRVSDATGELKIDHVGSPPLLQKMLDSDDCFILDIGSEIFVWIGKGCTKQESTQSMLHAQKFLEENNRPSWTSITRMVEGAEIPSFIEQFRSWVGVDTTDHSAGPILNTQHGRVAKRKEQQEIDVDSLIKSATPSKEPIVERKADFGYNYTLPDKYDTTVDAEINIYRVENFKRVPVPRETWGIFYGGDSYICTFEAKAGSNPPLVYYWLGKNSSRDERGAAALLTRDLCKTPNGKTPIIIRVIQGKEPTHFLNLFKGKMVIKFGGVPSGFHNVAEESSTVHTGPALFHVKGTTELDTKALQVTALTGNLNSADAFVLQDDDNNQQFIWYGCGCEDIEKATANSVAEFLRTGHPTMKFTAFDEGSESETFWKILGGRGKYLNDPDLQGDVKEPRMFSCSNASGVFEIAECEYITQDDLDASDIFLLDCSTRCYVWVGPESNEIERKMTFEYSLKYVERAIQLDEKRPRFCPVIVVDAGHEPPGFTCWFHGWDIQIAQETAEAAGINPESQNSYNEKEQTGVRTVYEALKAYEQKTYPYSVLRRDTVDKPLPNGGRGIDTTKLEAYLSKDEFMQLFGMSHDAFYKQPEWKQRKAKGRLKLF